MKSFWFILVTFVFLFSCRTSDPMVLIQTEAKRAEKTQSIRKEPSGHIKPQAKQRKENIEEKSKPEKNTIAREQNQESEKPPTSKGQMSEMMARRQGVRAATEEEIAVEESLMSEITGLIIEETMTKVGYEFYEYFFLLWNPPLMAEIQDYNITIHERASAMWGIWIWVNVNDTTIWNKTLRPRSAEVEEAAKEAIEVTKQYVANYQKYQFESDDLVGTGI
ncbi:MAG: hypothetical protein JXM79_09550 [Sedimentisphaerales bacterium]|nr:hypothetical protein [Sedimentisphaerales bacterium]